MSGAERTATSAAAPTPDGAGPHQGLAAKLAALCLSADEAIALDTLIARSTALGVAHVEPVEDPALIPAAVQRSIVVRVARSASLQLDAARLAFADALTFLRASPHAPEARLSAAPAVDEAWHQFILFTREYAAYCDAIAGGMIHHCPHVEGESSPDGWLSAAQTYDFIVGLGYPLTPELWAPSRRSGALARLTAR